MNRKTKDTWDLIVMVGTVFAAIEIPLRLSLGYRVTGALLAIDWIITGLFAVDVVLNFITPIRVGRHEITDRGEIGRRYLRTWFLIDVAATIPFDFLASMMGMHGGALQRLRFLRSLRVVRLARLATLMRHWQHRPTQSHGLLRLIFFLFWVGMIAHWIACGWISLAIPPEGKPLPPSTAYLEAAYWTITTLTTVGYGDVTPSTSVQKIYTMVVMMLGVGIYGYVIGNVATLLSNIDATRAAHLKKLENVSRFMRDRGLPVELQARVQDYYDYLWESGRGRDDAGVIADLPRSLRLEITLNLNRHIVQKVPLFQGASEAFIRELVGSLIPVVATPGDFVIQEGDMGQEMFFISRGSVEVIAGGKRVARLSDGDFFGEMSLLLSEPRTASIRATDYCDLYSVNKEAFDLVLERHAEFANKLRQVAAQRTRGLESGPRETLYPPAPKKES